MKISTVKISEIANHPTMRMDAKYWIKEKEKPLRIKVRFNLGRGKHYMMWKIQSNAGVQYHRPEDVNLILKKCQLKNNRKVAERIFNGEYKDVCAWILCESITIVPLEFCSSDFKSDTADMLRYNPKKNPFWTLNGECVDNNNYENLYTVGKNIFKTKQ
jgi:hypothetical protein